MKKFYSVTLIILAVFIFATWQYRLGCVLLLVLINKKWITSRPMMNRWRHSFKALCTCIALGIFIAIPNYWQRGNIQLIYLDDDNNEIKPPLPVYVANVLVPEEEACNLGIKATALLPPSGINTFGHNLGGSLVIDAHNDFWRGKMLSFYKPYNDISLRMSNPGSSVYGQLWNEATGDNLDAIYIQDNRSMFHKDEPAKVVFFCHGFLGNWELYQGVLADLENCVTVSIGTRDMTGIFSYNDINKIFTKYIPYLQSKGIDVNMSDVHIIGLSNGGTASNIALANFSNRFRTITYISTSCDVIKHTKASVILIGGANDHSSRGLPSAHQRLRNCGTQSDILFMDNTNHFMLVDKRKDVIDFLNSKIY